MKRAKALARRFGVQRLVVQSCRSAYFRGASLNRNTVLGLLFSLLAVSPNPLRAQIPESHQEQRVRAGCESDADVLSLTVRRTRCGELMEAEPAFTPLENRMLDIPSPTVPASRVCDPVWDGVLFGVPTGAFLGMVTFVGLGVAGALSDVVAPGEESLDVSYSTLKLFTAGGAVAGGIGGYILDSRNCAPPW